MGRDDDDNDDVGTDGGWVDLARAHPVRDDDPSVGGPQRGRRRCPPGRGAHAIGLAVVALGAASSAVTHYSALSSGTWTTSHYSTDDDDPPRPTNAVSGGRGGGGGRSRRGDGMHVCTCLADDGDTDEPPPDPPRRLRWLHIPKTGTSFISTLWSYATSNEDRYIDLSVHSHSCDNYANKTFSMYDFVLMRRYPWEVYGAPNLIHPALLEDLIADARSSSRRVDGRAVPLGLVGGTQHLSLIQGSGDPRYASGRLNKNIRNLGSELLERNFTVAAFFRRPEDRIVSAYYDGRHANGFSPGTSRELLAASVQRKANHTCAIRRGGSNNGTTTETYRNPLECFVRFPGIAGCASRMLTGENCADDATRGDGTDNVRDAIDAVSNRLGFVGLTEEWDESVCHFHRMFGRRKGAAVGGDEGIDGDEGNGDDGGGGRDRPPRRRRGGWVHPLQGEFGNVHKSAAKKVHDVEDLNGFVDVADSAVYEAARLRFEAMVGDRGRCHRYMTWDEIDASAAGGSRLPDFARDGAGRVCEAMSCSDLGRQCGEWDDGCGGTVICGMCDPGRTGLPSTWRIKCVEGRCIDYCPPWDERGLWSLPDDSSSEMNRIGEVIGVSDGQRFLSPVDAVAICQIACNAKTQFRGGLESFVNTGLCRCGTTAKILSKNLTHLDFTSAHDMNTACHANKARKDGWLTSRETQPVCCPYMDPQTKIPVGWTRMNTLGAFNVEGEYFDHVRMECGAFKECEKAAREGGAEVAVFDLFNRMCYLVRNTFDLGDMYTVTKDNYMRYAMDLRLKSARTFIARTNRTFIARTKDGRFSKKPA